VKAAHYPVIVWIGFFCHRKKKRYDGKGEGLFQTQTDCWKQQEDEVESGQ